MRRALDRQHQDRGLPGGLARATKDTYVRRGSKKAARGARETGRLIAATRERADFARRTQQRIRAAGDAEGQAERRRQRFLARSFSRLTAAERQRVKALLLEFGNRRVPRNVDTGLSQTGFWLFFQAGGQTG